VKARFVGHPWGEGRSPLSDDELTRADCVDYVRGQAVPHEALRRPGTAANRSLEQAICLHRSCLPLV
jgi:hypothetical protein